MPACKLRLIFARLWCWINPEQIVAVSGTGGKWKELLFRRQPITPTMADFNQLIQATLQSQDKCRIQDSGMSRIYCPEVHGYAKSIPILTAIHPYDGIWGLDDWLLPECSSQKWKKCQWWKLLNITRKFGYWFLKSWSSPSIICLIPISFLALL